MPEPIGDPNVFVRRGAEAPGGRLVMTDEAVQRWIKAYTDYALQMTEIAGQIERYRKDTYFGDLDSLRQLAAGYDQLLMGGEGSLHQRVVEFSEAATLFAEKLRADWGQLLEADGQTAAALRISS